MAQNPPTHLAALVLLFQIRKGYPGYVGHKRGDQRQDTGGEERQQAGAECYPVGNVSGFSQHDSMMPLLEKGW